MKRKAPKVSYIVAVYNKSKYISLVIESILNQCEINNFEIIIVNDGSSDDSLKKIYKIAKNKKNIFVINQSNTGPSIACNVGLKKATGDFIKFVDADDILLPWSTIMLMKPFYYNDIVLSFSRNTLTYDEVPKSLSSLFKKYNIIKSNIIGEYKFHKDYLKNSLHVSNMNLSCMLFKRSEINKFGGCNEKIFCQDYFIELMLTSSGAVMEWKELVFLSPLFDKERVTSNEAQILHDLNLALEEFVLINKTVKEKFGKKILKRAFSRQFNFLKRNKIRAFTANFIKCYILSHLNLLKVKQSNFQKSRILFSKYFQIK